MKMENELLSNEETIPLFLTLTATAILNDIILLESKPFIEEFKE